MLPDDPVDVISDEFGDPPVERGSCSDESGFRDIDYATTLLYLAVTEENAEDYLGKVVELVDSATEDVDDDLAPYLARPEPQVLEYDENGNVTRTPDDWSLDELVTKQAYEEHRDRKQQRALAARVARPLSPRPHLPRRVRRVRFRSAVRRVRRTASCRSPGRPREDDPELARAAAA